MATKPEINIAIQAETAKLHAGLRQAEAEVRRFAQRAEQASRGGLGAAIGDVQNVVKLGVALKGAELGIRGALAGAKLMSGELKNWNEFVSEAVRAIPGIGPAISEALAYVRAQDVKDAQEAENKLAVRQKARFDAQRRATAEAFRDRASQIEDSRTVARNPVAERREIMELEKQRQQALRDVERQFRSAPGAEQSRELREARAALELQIEEDFSERKVRVRQKYEIQAAEKAKKAAEERAREQERVAKEELQKAQRLADVQSEIIQKRHSLEGRELDAQIERIRHHYDRRIEEAKRSGEAELVSELERLKKLEEAQARKADATKKAAEEEKKARMAAQFATFQAGNMFSGGDGGDEMSAFRQRMADAIKAGGKNYMVSPWDRQRAALAEGLRGTREQGLSDKETKDLLRQIARNTGVKAPIAT